MAQTRYLTLASAVDDLAQSGFREHFRVKAGRLLGLESGKAFSAAELVIRSYHRFEGVSDPDDMAIVYAIESRSGVRGALVDAFGVYADPEVGALLERVPIRREAALGEVRAALPRMVCQPLRAPFVFGPRSHPTAVGALAAATPRTWRHDYGFPAPASGDPWQDDGGED